MLRGFSKRHLRRLASKRLQEFRQSNFQEETVGRLEVQEDVGLERDVDDEETVIDAFKMTLRKKLVEWYHKHNPSRNCCDDLLKILKSEDLDVPTSLKGLLGANKNKIVTRTVSPGTYVHFGVKTNIDFIVSGLGDTDELLLDIGVDGLPLFKSSRTCVYLGNQKPNNVDNFLHDFVNEMTQLYQYGYQFEEGMEEQLVKIQTTLDQLIRKNVQVAENKHMFPVLSVKDLAEVEKDFKLNFEKNAQILKVIINPGGLLQNFNRLFANELILNMNYDGICEKHAFKQYTTLSKAIFEAIAKEGLTPEQYVKDLRLCFRTYKNRIFKRKYDKERRQ